MVCVLPPCIYCRGRGAIKIYLSSFHESPSTYLCTHTVTPTLQDMPGNIQGVCTHTHTHTRTHIHTHTHTHTQAGTSIFTHRHTSRGHTQTRPNAHTYMHTQIHPLSPGASQTKALPSDFHTPASRFYGQIIISCKAESPPL